MPSSLLGSAVRRVEDPRLVTGAASFVPDLIEPGALHAVFVRSQMAHARIRVDPTPARGLPGVVGVYTAADLELAPVPPADAFAPVFARPVLAADLARYMGEPVAVVLAETAALATDAA